MSTQNNFANRHKKRYRWLSLLLCLMLCIDGTSVSTIAASAEDNKEIDANASTEDINTENEFNFEEENKNEINTTEKSTESANENDEVEESSSESKTESSTEEEPSTNENETSNPETSEEDSSEIESSEEQTTESESSEEETSSENETLTEETTEPESDAISDTDMDALSAEQIATAEKDFSELLLEKDLMALLYKTESYQVRTEPDTDSDTVAVIESGHTLYICGVKITGDTVWYHVRFGYDGAEKSGYIESNYLAYSNEDWITWERIHLEPLFAGTTTYGVTAYSSSASAGSKAVDTSDIDAFPILYQNDLRKLKEAHPNWLFVPMNTKLDFNTAVSNEVGVKNLIQNNSSNAAKGWVGAPCPTESGWYYATRAAVEYYMNPCNFLTETYIFQFEQLTFNNSYHTVNAIQTFLNNTFMKGAIPGDSGNRTYAAAFYEIGKDRKLSPIHLASRVYQEQGAGTSGLISGTYKGYEGYYNYFNVGASGSTAAAIITSGLQYAKSKGWNTRYKSLSGGAATIGNNYVLKGQDTLYLQKFNVDGNYNPLYTHQYMQNVQAPASEASSTKRMYTNAGSLNSPFVFKIPVYENMPGGIPIQSISLDISQTTLRRSDTVVSDTTGLTEEEIQTNRSTAAFKVSFNPSDATDSKALTWSFSKPNVVSIKAGKTPQDYTVAAVGIGETTVTATTVNGKKASFKVKVIAPMYKLELTNTNDTSTLFVGQRMNLTAEYWPKDTTSDTNITWSSSNPEIASVSKGAVTAHATGSAVITAAVDKFQASYQIDVDECRVAFMDEEGTTVLKETTVPYGGTIPSEFFPEMESGENRIFTGWYTKQNGTGVCFQPDTAIHDKYTVLYPHFEDQDKGFYVLPVGDHTYTGSAIKPTVHVYDGLVYEDGSHEIIELVQGKDYTVSYKNNKNVTPEGSSAVPTIIVKGKGNYSGTEYVYFNILAKPLTDMDITADNITVAYNGNTLKKAPVVYRSGKKLAANRDYKVSYPQSGSGAYKSAGVYPIVITGKGGYTGTITIHETITKNVMMSKVSIAKIPNQPYQEEQINKSAGIGIVPEKLTVTYQKKPLIESTDGGITGDYTVTYTNNMAIGTAAATITAVEGSAFSGSKKITYKITGSSINKAVVNGIVPKEYTGNEQDVLQNDVTLTLNGTTLTPSTDGGITGDYVVSYTNTSKAGTASILFKGINSYCGQIKKTYKIQHCTLGSDEQGLNPLITLAYYTQHSTPEQAQSISSLSEISSPYMKGSVKPTVLLYYDGKPLTLGKDYTVKYTNNKAVTTADMTEKKLPKITITGKGNYRGRISGTWRITDGQLEDGKVSMTAKDIVYKNKVNSYKTTVTLTDANGSKLAAGKDYDKNLIYTYEKDTVVNAVDGSTINRSAGDAVETGDIPMADTEIRVTAKGIGAYIGAGDAALSRVYRIIAADISKAKITAEAKVYANGKAITLTGDDLKVTVSGDTLTYGEDYIIDEHTYTNNTNKGKATVILRGIGKNYGGEKKITFTIGSKTLVWWKNLLN